MNYLKKINTYIHFKNSINSIFFNQICGKLSTVKSTGICSGNESELRHEYNE